MSAAKHNEKATDSDNGSDSSSQIIPMGTPLTFDPKLDATVWRKLDFYILPVVAIFYLLSFLDRTNFGNARVAGLQKELKLTNKQYSIALTVTYVPYIFAELPSNLVLRAVGPNLLLPTLLSLWGIVTTLQGIVHNYAGLLACRFSWACLRWRVTAFFSSATLSGAFGGILAYGIVRMNGVGGRPGWAWIFILEGLFTVVFGVISFFILPRDPSRVRFFNEREKAYVIARLNEDGSRNDKADVFSWKEVAKAFTSPHVGILAIALFLDGTMVYALAYFLPSIVQQLGYTASSAQLMTVPPFAAAFVVSLILAYISDHYRCRGLVTIFSSILAVIGFAIYLVSHNRHVQYGSLFFSVAGAYSSAAALSTWNANNSTPHTRRATTIAIGFIMTNSGGILATWLLGALSPPPRYTLATITLLSFSAACAVLSGLNLVYLWYQNRRKAAIRRVKSREEERQGLGDKSAWFEYNL